MRRSRVLAVGESSPGIACARRPPRWVIAWSTAWAIAIAIATVMTAVIRFSFSVQNEATTMAVREAIARPRLEALGAERIEALRDAALALVVSRALVWVVAVVAAAVGSPDGGASALAFDTPGLTHPFGGVLDDAFAPLARWDSVWYLAIAQGGYDTAQSTAFFPLYPLLVRTLAPTGDPGALLFASYAVSILALAGALYLLRRLAELELGAAAARRTVFLLALFPGALWFGVPYSESVFLLLSVGAFYAARTGRWAWAGACAALASGTRSAGVLLVIPLAIFWWRARPRRARDAAWLGLAPGGLAAYSGWLAATEGDAFAYMHLQSVWYRSFELPLGAVIDGAQAAWEGARQLLSGAREPVFFEPAGGDPFIAAAHNLELFAFLVVALIATAGVLRRLPAAYGAYVVAALALPLSFPVAPQPLMSLPRFLAVLFPLFMWLATKRGHRVVLALFALAPVRVHGPLRDLALGRVEAVLLDAFGTLVAMEPPAPRLRAELARPRRRRGRGAGWRGVPRRDRLLPRAPHRRPRRRVARRAARSLRGGAARGARRAGARPRRRARGAARLAPLRCLRRRGAGAAPRCASRGLTLVVCSNWDCSLPEVLHEAGLRELVDGVVTSAEVGARKPDPRLFEAALAGRGRTRRRARSTSAIRRRATWAARRRPGCARCSCAGRRERPDRVDEDRSAGPEPSAVIASLADLAYVI